MSIDMPISNTEFQEAVDGHVTALLSLLDARIALEGHDQHRGLYGNVIVSTALGVAAYAAAMFSDADRPKVLERFRGELARHVDVIVAQDDPAPEPPAGAGAGLTLN